MAKRKTKWEKIDSNMIDLSQEALDAWSQMISRIKIGLGTINKSTDGLDQMEVWLSSKGKLELRSHSAHVSPKMEVPKGHWQRTSKN